MDERQGTILNEIQLMSKSPRQRIYHHRRARSESFFSNTDSINDLLFDPSDVDLSFDFYPPPQTQTQPMSEDTTSLPPKPKHIRSLSVDDDSDFFDDLDDHKKPSKHHRSSSMDGAASFNIESILNGTLTSTKKNMGMGSERLAELALLDPKRAKRILANRQSAARSKERKIKYTGELERKVQTLQSEATTLSAQVTMLQRGTSDLTTENKHLKMRLQALEQQAELKDALSETLRAELNRLKIAAGEIPQGNGKSYNHPQYSSQQLAMHQFGNNKNGQPTPPSFMDFTKRV